MFLRQLQTKACWGCYGIKAVSECDSCHGQFSVCVFVLQGGLSVLACSESNDTPHHPNQTTPLSTPQCFPLLPRLSWRQHGMPHTGRSDSLASVTFLSLPWITTQRLPRGSVWNMAVLLFAVIYGGSRACQTTLLRLHFIPEHRNYYACLIHRRGNYSIMVHGEFFAVGLRSRVQEQQTRWSFLIRKTGTVLKYLRRFKCATDSCARLKNCECSCGHVLDLLVLMFEKYNWCWGK